MSYIKARPTIYKGIQMRSRLEAAYAQSLDNQDPSPRWEYEPECFADESGQYLPDFRLWLLHYIEVKPSNADFTAALDRMHVIRSTHPKAFLDVVTKAGEHDDFVTVARCWPGRPCDACRPPQLGTIIDPTGETYMGHTKIVCSECKGMYVHPSLSDRTDFDDNATDSGLAIELTCELCGCITELAFQSRKGCAYVTLDTVKQSEVT